MSIRHPFAVFVLMAMAMSLVWSRALLSILPFLLVIPAFFDIRIHPFAFRWAFTVDLLKESVRTRPYIWVFTLFFFLYLAGILYGGDIGEWWRLTHMKSGFLILPFCIGLFQAFSRREYMLIFLCMIITALWSTVWVQVAYFSNYDLFTQSLGFGSAVPTPIHHIRYSVVVAASMIICTGFAMEDWRLKFRQERWVYAIAAIYLFYFLHILAVRSGLILAYAGIFTLLLFYLRKISSLKKIALLILLILAPAIAYKTLPGFQLKVRYSLYDLNQFLKGEGETYSDAKRWQSWRAGLMTGNQHPLFGTGPGNFQKALSSHYENEFSSKTWTRPHNQWINVFAVFGLLGLFVFMIMIIYPMTVYKFWVVPFMAVLYIMQLVSMLVEHPLDTIFGTSLFLMTTLISLNFNSKKTS